MTTYVSRSQSGLAAPEGSYSKLSLPTHGTAVHYNGPPMGLADATHPSGALAAAECASKVRGIQRLHMENDGENEMMDVAYTSMICPHGFVYIGRDVGNRTGANGTTYGNDSYYATMLLIGGDEPLTVAMKRALADEILRLRRDGRAGDDVVPHSALRATSCPGDPGRDFLTDELRDYLDPVPPEVVNARRILFVVRGTPEARLIEHYPAIFDSYRIRRLGSPRELDTVPADRFPNATSLGFRHPKVATAIAGETRYETLFMVAHRARPDGEV